MDDDLGWQAMQILAQEWRRSGPPGIVETRSIAIEIGISIDRLLEALKPLYVKGWVDASEDGHAFFLTPEGYAQLSEL